MGHARHDGGGQKVTVHRAITAKDHCRAFGQRVVDVFFDLFTGGGVDQGAKFNACLETVTDLHFLNAGFQLFREGIVDASLHIDAVRTDAGLAVVAEFAQDCALNRCIKVCIIKHDERRVAAQLH